jgi:hypothetical protein
MGEKRNAYRILVEKPLGKCLLGRMMRWEDNIKMGWYYWVSGLCSPSNTNCNVLSSELFRIH